MADDIEEDLRLMRMRRWREKQREKSGQKSFGRPRSHMGCSFKE
jgi:hypothetical protein